MADPKTGIKDVIKDGWDDDNTESITPSFSTGWYSVKNASPQVTITDEEEATLSDGPTGILGIATGGVPAQYWVGSVAVNCWVTREDTDVNPKKLIDLFKKEIKRLIRAHYDDVTDLDFITWMGGHEIVESDKKPVVYRYAGVVAFGYLD